MTDKKLTQAERERLYRSEQWTAADERKVFDSLTGKVPKGPHPVHRILHAEWRGATVKDYGRPGSSIHEIAQRRAAALGLVERLGRATDSDILTAITEAYDATDVAKQKPPNINEIGAAVLPLLAQKGLKCSENRVKTLAHNPSHRARRNPVGRKRVRNL